MEVVEVDVDDNVEHVAENTPYITLIHTWRSRGAHHRPHTYDVCLAGRIQSRGQLHYSCHRGPICPQPDLRTQQARIPSAA